MASSAHDRRHRRARSRHASHTRLVAAIIGLALFASGTPSPAVRHLQRSVGLLADRPHARLRDLRVRRARHADRSPGASPTRSAGDPVLLVALGDPARRDGPVHGRRLGRLAVRRPRPAGSRDRPGTRGRGAALLDLHPRRDPAGVGLANGVASAAGMGLGVLVSAPSSSCCPPLACCRTCCCSCSSRSRSPARCGCPSRSPSASRLRLTPQRPSVPAVVRAAVLARRARACSPRGRSAACSCRSGRSSRPSLFHTTNHLVAGVRVFVLAGSAAIAQLVFGRSAPWLGASLGSIALATGLLLIVLVGGDELERALPDRRRDRRRRVRRRVPRRPARALGRHPARAPRRGDVGVLRRRLRVAVAARDARRRRRHALGLQSTFEIFGSVVAAIALAVAFEAWRTRPVLRLTFAEK